MILQMKYIVSVSKTYIHRGNHKHRDSTKKYWHIYYYDEYGKFNTKRVSLLQALYYKTQKKKRMKFVCDECETIFMVLVKSKNKIIPCPNCD